MEGAETTDEPPRSFLQGRRVHTSPRSSYFRPAGAAALWRRETHVHPQIEKKEGKKNGAVSGLVS